MDNRLKQPKIKDLIKTLKQYDQEKLIMLAVDEEQNAIADDIAIEEGLNYITLLPLNPQEPE